GGAQSAAGRYANMSPRLSVRRAAAQRIMSGTQRASDAATSTKAGGFETSGIGSDLSAALTKAIDGVTGGLANAVLAGVNPVHGMYTVMIATPVGALFTSWVFMNIDSTSAISVTAGSMLIDYPTEARSQALVVLTLLVGGCMLLTG